MKQVIFLFVILSVLLSACGASASEPPVATEPPAQQTNVNCVEVALALDPALASGFRCQSVAEAGGPDSPTFGINPKYTELSLDGYTLSDRSFTPKIAVYPVQRFSELLPDVIPAGVSALQALMDGGRSSDKGLPFLPVLNEAQMFFAQYKVISFTSGKGIRYITQFSQSARPVNNQEMVYTFQGLTSDGKYWISAILPISSPLLLEDGKNPPNGQSLEDFVANFQAYITDLTTQLDSQPSENYSPTIPMLDALVSSISIQP